MAPKYPPLSPATSTSSYPESYPALSPRAPRSPSRPPVSLSTRHDPYPPAYATQVPRDSSRPPVSSTTRQARSTHTQVPSSYALEPRSSQPTTRGVLRPIAPRPPDSHTAAYAPSGITASHPSPSEPRPYARQTRTSHASPPSLLSPGFNPSGTRWSSPQGQGSSRNTSPLPDSVFNTPTPAPLRGSRDALGPGWSEADDRLLLECCDKGESYGYIASVRFHGFTTARECEQRYNYLRPPDPARVPYQQDTVRRQVGYNWASTQPTGQSGLRHTEPQGYPTIWASMQPTGQSGLRHAEPQGYPTIRTQYHPLQPIGDPSTSERLGTYTGRGPHRNRTSSQVRQRPQDRQLEPRGHADIHHPRPQDNGSSSESEFSNESVAEKAMTEARSHRLEPRGNPPSQISDQPPRRRVKARERKRIEHPSKLPRWTAEEDQRLVDLREKGRPFRTIAREDMTNRSKTSLESRWSAILKFRHTDVGKPRSVRGWMPTEDAQLVRMIEEGLTWHEMDNQIEGRTSEACRNRWKQLRHNHPGITYSRRGRG